ncbi:MAG: hypothetical protein ACRCVT_08805 [Leadbetterella sp.]
MSKDSFYIEKCRSLIEEKLDWGESADWQNQDFEVLSERIFAETKVNLSITTLKRIWGKATYTSNPNLATLNALAAFVGFENWRAFTSNGFQPTQHPLEIQKTQLSQKSKKSYILWAGMSATILLLCFGTWAYNQNTQKLKYGNIQFTSKPVTKGLPNSVIFNYDVSDSNADSVFIQQSWDKRLRQKIDTFKNEYVCTYYRPGYYRAKLILNDSIVKEHDVFVESEGWMGILEKEPIPIYFPTKTIQKDNLLGISADEVSQQGFDLKKEIPWICLTEVNKNKTVSADNFYAETEIRNTFKKGDAICQHSTIVLLGTDNVIVIPLTIKGCVGEIDLSSISKEAKSKNLAVFGVDFQKWVKVRCEVKNAIIKVFINDQLGFEGEQDKIKGRVVGTRIRFKGAGEVKRFEMGSL